MATEPIHLAIRQQITWSSQTFGPGERCDGLIDHIVKELAEIHKDPHDMLEWIDVMILAIDGAWRNCFPPDMSPAEKARRILEAYINKMETNKKRKWPDWRKFTDGQAIEHIRE